MFIEKPRGLINQR